MGWCLSHLHRCGHWGMAVFHHALGSRLVGITMLAGAGMSAIAYAVAAQARSLAMHCIAAEDVTLHCEWVFEAW